MVGVRYCGGCNPHYDRKAFVERVAKHLEGKTELEVAKEGVVYDALMVVGGCTNCCASHSQFTSNTKPKLIWGDEFFDETVAIIEGTL